MTSKIFTEYLINWNKKLVISKRKIILFVDNCPAHPNITLTNITLCVFPVNTTSVLQPLDQGIIHSFKAKYRNYMMNSIMAQIESECDKIKLPDILDAMVIVNKSWELVTQETIKNCFKKAFFEFETFIHDQSDKDMIDSCSVCMHEDDFIC